MVLMVHGPRPCHQLLIAPPDNLPWDDLHVHNRKEVQITWTLKKVLCAKTANFGGFLIDEAHADTASPAQPSANRIA